MSLTSITSPLAIIYPPLTTPATILALLYIHMVGIGLMNPFLLSGHMIGVYLRDLFLIVGDVLKEMKTHSFVDDPHFVDMMTALTSPLVKCKDCGVSYYRDTLTHEQDKCKAKDTIRDHWKPLPGCVVTGQDIANANVYVDVEILKNIDIRLIKDDESV